MHILDPMCQGCRFGAGIGRKRTFWGGVSDNLSLLGPVSRIDLFLTPFPSVLGRFRGRFGAISVEMVCFEESITRAPPRLFRILKKAKST